MFSIIDFYHEFLRTNLPWGNGTAMQQSCASCAQAVRPSGMPCTRKTVQSSPFN
ncbi:MAG: hypothetical protein WC091_14790 [Sulfuricellaceae bacterium]